MVSAMKNNQITKWRNNNICALFHPTSFDKLTLVNIKEYLEEIDKEITSEDTVIKYPVEDLEAACPAGTKPCGRMSNPDVFACFDKNSPCPINSIIINENSSPPDDTYFSLFFGDGFFLHYSKDKITNYLISGDFRIEGEKVCMHSSERIGSLDNSESSGSVVEECTRKVGGTLHDDVLTQLDTTSKHLLYSNNDLTKLYHSNFLYNDIIDDTDVNLNLFSKPFMYFKDSCANEGETKAFTVSKRQFYNKEFNSVCFALIFFSSIGKPLFEFGLLT